MKTFGPTRPASLSRKHRASARTSGIVAMAILMLTSLLSLAPFTSVARAATGDLVGSVNFSQDCTSGLGVGTTYDGANLWYTCHGQSPDLLRADPRTGQVTASYSIAGGLGALAYDAGRNAIWAGNSGGNSGNVYLITLDGSRNVTGSSLKFNTCSAFCNDIDDGLAYDSSDDTLYYSPDTSTTIYHYSSAGSLISSFPWAGSSCYNSGLALGGGDIYEGSDGCNMVWVVAKTAPSTVLFSFSTVVSGDPNFRDESLTCDPNTFSYEGKSVMWSKEAYSPMRAHAFEVPSGTCGVGGGSTSSPIGGPITKQEKGSPSENPTDCNTAQPVNCDTGEFWHTFTDLAIPGRGPALDLTRTYRSVFAGTNGPFGYGWSSGYTMGLSNNTPVTGTVTISQENGSTATFTLNSGGVYTAPPRVLASLVHNGDGTWTFTRRARTKFTFAASGRLTAIADLNGYATALSYNGSGQLTTVTDAAGRALTVAYGANGDISSVTDPTGRKVSYGYDASGNLTSVVDVANGTTSFTYDAGGHFLLTMTDPRHGVLTNVYDASSRVTSQTDAMNRKTTFAYVGDNSSPSGGTTTITDPKGDVERPTSTRS